MASTSAVSKASRADVLAPRRGCKVRYANWAEAQTDTGVSFGYGSGNDEVSETQRRGDLVECE